MKLLGTVAREVAAFVREAGRPVARVASEAAAETGLIASDVVQLSHPLVTGVRRHLPFVGAGPRGTALPGRAEGGAPLRPDPTRLPP